MPSASELPTDFDVEALIRLCVRLIVERLDFADYRARVARDGASLWDGAPHDGGSGAVRAMANLIARSVWKHCPHPAHRYAPAPLPTPERNAPCHCGSGRKYKQCCMTPEAGVPLDQFNFLSLLIDALPRARWAELADSRIPLDMVLDVAEGWLAERRAEDVHDLLRPWFDGDRHWKLRYGLLFDALLDAYDALGDHNGRLDLLERAERKGDASMRSGALQRRAAMAADLGDFRLAWSLFHQAQRADPEALSLCNLELAMLVSEGREAEARERARSWLMRLQPLRDPALESLIGFIREVAETGGAALKRATPAQEPALDALLECWRRAPPLSCRYRLRPTRESAGGLIPDAGLASELKRWREAFEPIDYSPLRAHGGDRWADAASWVAVLQEHPQLWNSFEVLDALARVLGEAPVASAFERLALPLLQRSEALLREVLRVNGAQDLCFEWHCHENRPALNALATLLLYRLDTEGFVPDVMAGLEWCVLVLNPDDNFGLRQELMRGYLQTGNLEAALALGSLFAEDVAAMRYSRALALFASGLADDALSALGQAAEESPKVLEFLLAKNPREPREQGPGYLIGGEREAWLYRESHLALWQGFGGIEWARSASRAFGPRPPVGSPGPGTRAS